MRRRCNSTPSLAGALSLLPSESISAYSCVARSSTSTAEANLSCGESLLLDMLDFREYVRDTPCDRAMVRSISVLVDERLSWAEAPASRPVKRWSSDAVSLSVSSVGSFANVVLFPVSALRSLEEVLCGCSETFVLLLEERGPPCATRASLEFSFISSETWRCKSVSSSSGQPAQPQACAWSSSWRNLALFPRSRSSNSCVDSRRVCALSTLSESEESVSGLGASMNRVPRLFTATDSSGPGASESTERGLAKVGLGS
mmetsp:Transcript_32019/g.85762  ORF Transcript_32019/g.85762 Transcript_32019/m.85762 type:complete len:258 (+) Transcript_32019:1027-1800(+)